MRELYQKADILSTPEMETLERILKSWYEVGDFERSFHAFEKGVHRALADLESAIIGRALKELDVECHEIEVGGCVYRKAYRLSQTYCGLSGEFVVERNLYKPVGRTGPSICPLDYRARIMEGTWTPSAGELMAYSVAVMTPYEAEELFQRFGGMRPSRSSLERLPKMVSRRWEENRLMWEEALRSQETLPSGAATVAISLDGVMTPMKGGQRLEKRAQARGEGKRTRGPAGFKEASCGTFSFHDEDGERLKTLYYGRMPEARKGILSDQLGHEAASLLDARPELKVVLLADGAKDNWRILRGIVERCLREGLLTEDSRIYEVTDFYHACEHLKVVTDLYYGENSIESRCCFEKLKIILEEEEGGIHRVLRKFKYFRNRRRKNRRKKLTTEINYFRNRQASMNYPEFAKLNLPIASGVVEAACKTLVTQRLKRSGMRWTIDGGQSVLTLRSLLKSERWDSGWGLISKSYHANIRMVTKKNHLALIQPLEKAA